jgi:hypothetical protein
MRHQVPVDKAVPDAEAVRRDQKREDRDEHEFRSPAELRPRESSDSRDKMRRESGGGGSLRWHASPRQIGGRFEG